MDNEKMESMLDTEDGNVQEERLTFETVDPVVAAFSALHETAGEENEAPSEERECEPPSVPVSAPTPLPPALQKKLPARAAVISTAGWFWTLFLFHIPILGLLVAGLFACGLSRRQNRINFARAYLAIVGIFAFLFLIALLCLWIWLGTKATLAFSSIFDGEWKSAVLHLIS